MKIRGRCVTKHQNQIVTEIGYQICLVTDGQIAMLVPSLDLSIVFNAGDSSDGVMFRIQNELIPEYILPAVGE